MKTDSITENARYKAFMHREGVEAEAELEASRRRLRAAIDGLSDVDLARLLASHPRMLRWLRHVRAE